MTTATLTRTDDLLSTLRAKQSQLTSFLSPNGETLHLPNLAEQLEGGTLPGAATRRALDLNAERHELVAELRDSDTKAARARAAHLLVAIELVLSDDLDGFAALTPVGDTPQAPKPAPSPEPAPAIQPTRSELVQSAYAIAAAYAGARCTCGGGETLLRENKRTNEVRIEVVHHAACQLPPALSRALASIDPNLTLVAHSG